MGSVTTAPDPMFEKRLTGRERTQLAAWDPPAGVTQIEGCRDHENSEKHDATCDVTVTLPTERLMEV